MSESGARFVTEPEAIRVLEGYGIPYPEHGLARSPQEAARIADELGYPVVMKVVSPDVVHKSGVGGVVVGLGDAASVRAAYEVMVTRVRTATPNARIEGALVCRQAPEGPEVIVGALDDATFGPTVMFGLGGIFAEVLKDVSFRVIPLEPRDAEEMVREIRGYALLSGTRGKPGCDLNAVAELLLAVSSMVWGRKEIKELDLNPVRVYERGLLVLDARLLEKGG